MKKKILVAGFLALLAVVAFVALGARAAMQAKRVRQSPERTAFLEAVNAAEPKGALLRYLLLRPGDHFYHLTILPWLYSDSSRLEDNFWNRKILERHLLSISRGLALDYIARYPLTPGPALQPILFQALQEGDLRALPTLGHFEEGRAMLDQWLEESLLGPGDFVLFTKAFGQLMQVRSIDPAVLMDRFAEHLDADPDSYSLFRDSEALAEILLGSPNGDRLLEWVSSAVTSGKLSLAGAEGWLSALLVTPETSDATARFLLDHERLFPRNELARFALPAWCFEVEAYNCELSATLPDNFLDQAFAGLRGDPERFLTLFHAMAHAGDPRLGRVSGELLAGPDSELRKGMIVLLARHEGVGVTFDVDLAFSGEAPRPVLFSSQSQYLESGALERYEELAGHRYDRIGKRFPPYLGGRLPQPAHVDQWRDFIAAYPWFPATDDAYYRLAHVQFVQGDLEGALDTIEEYRRRSFVDDDIEPYMARLEVTVHSAAAEGSLGDALELARIGSLPWLLDAPEGVELLERFALAVDWLLMAQMTEVASRDFLRSVRRDLDRVRADCTLSYFERCELPPSAHALVSRLNAESR